jgi:oxygen-independent coproporphyrinogen-3 oxidase
MNISSNPGLYLHIPFCQSKCGYCDFYSIEDTSVIKPFIKTLLEEIDLTVNQIDNNALFDTIYLGGGTPSLLNIEDLELILNTLASRFKLDKSCEITIEINPGTVKLSQLKKMIAMGINRISIGVQSFLDHELIIAERIHTTEESVLSIENCREVGFNNINIDLIFALPNQSIENWNYSLERVISFNPEHISIYNLSYEEGTPFYEKIALGKLIQQSEEKQAKFFTTGHRFLVNKGYTHYEVSNYAKSENYISKHNYKYWNHTPYLGFGPSAHSFWRQSRWSNVRSISKYLTCLAKKELPRDFVEELTYEDIMFEHIFLALRTYRGILLDEFRNKFAVPFEEIYSADIQFLQQEKLAKMDNGYFKLTEKGLLICDEILPRFSKI